jgi:hypothetical protein
VATSNIGFSSHINQKNLQTFPRIEMLLASFVMNTDLRTVPVPFLQYAYLLDEKLPMAPLWPLKDCLCPFALQLSSCARASLHLD